MQNAARVITWKPKKVLLRDLKESPHYSAAINKKKKIILHKSISRFGLAGTIVVNRDLSILDGHGRKRDMEAQGKKRVWVSVPSRRLSKKDCLEFKELYKLTENFDTDTMLTEEGFAEEFIKEWRVKPSERPKKNNSG